jgi:uncharacterized peroxidase-related enzyme
MNPYQVHSVETAPFESQAILRQVKASLGLVPNLAAAMSESPSLVKGFFALREIYHEGTLSPLETQVLSLTNAFANGCHYCMALHSAFARKEGLSAESLAALREGRSPVEPKLCALSELSRKMIATRGQVGEADLAAFFAAGFTPAQALEVVLGIAVSILANFSHHLCNAPLDEAFRAYAWTAPEAARSPTSAAVTAEAAVV